MEESSNSPPEPVAGKPEDVDIFLSDEGPAELPVDDATAAVLAKLDQLQSGKRNWTHAIVVLVLTMVLFGAAEFLRGNPIKLAWLIIVLLIHESGHFVGMKLFGYRDVRMFFIPFFGAAVSGRSLHVPGYQAALVILLGPLPGIVIGVVLGLVNLAAKSPTVGELSLLFIVLNGFNLLPFMPLDGGRLLQLVLFSRQRHLEAIFQVVTGLVLAVVGFASRMWLLGGFGVLMVFGSSHSFRIRTIAQQMLQRLGDGWRAGLDDERVPPPIALQILDLIRARTPQLKDPKLLATTIQNVWERMHFQLPGALASVALLAVYGVSLFGTVIVWVVILLNQLKLGEIVPVEAPKVAAVRTTTPSPLSGEGRNDMVVNGIADLAPTGTDSIAQGAALGTNRKFDVKPQRGVVSLIEVRKFRPVGADASVGTRHPGPRPGLSNLAPLGLKSGRRKHPNDNHVQANSSPAGVTRAVA